MHPYVSIFGYPFPSYTLMILIGCAVSFTVVLARCPKKGMRADDSLFFIAFLFLGALAGAKALYLLLSIPEIWMYREIIFSSWENAVTLLTSGFVFYGGLIGGFIGAFCYAKYYGVNAVKIADNFIPAIPLFHAFGRIGCFLGGCCYGIEYDGVFAVTFTEALSDANGVSRFPVQLLEATINLGLFFVLFLLAGKLKKPLQNFGLYLILYAIVRFFLEFLRGDAARGFWGPLSSSQWIGLLLILPFGIYMFCADTKQNPVIQNLFNGRMPTAEKSTAV